MRSRGRTPTMPRHHSPPPPFAVGLLLLLVVPAAHSFLVPRPHVVATAPAATFASSPTRSPFSRRCWLRSENSDDGESAEGVGAPPATTELGLEEVPPEVSRRPPVDDIGAPANDIVQLVKPRADWWDEGALKSPIRGVANTNPDEDPLDKLILSLPIPSYGLLGICSFFAIAFVGCIFQLFYDQPPAPVLGVPLTALIFALSGPTWVFLFIAAIKKGQKEADDEDDFRY